MPDQFGNLYESMGDDDDNVDVVDDDDDNVDVVDDDDDDNSDDFYYP